MTAYGAHYKSKYKLHNQLQLSMKWFVFVAMAALRDDCVPIHMQMYFQTTEKTAAAIVGATETHWL